MPMDASDRAKEIIATTERLKTDRATFDAHYEEIHQYAFPEITPPTQGTVTNPGEKARAEVLDNTAENANEMLSAAIHDSLTPDTIDWFALRVTDDDALNEDQDVAAWLEDCTRRMLNVFRSPKAGYALAAHEMRVDLVTFGTGAMTILDRPGEGIVFAAVPLRELYLEVDPDGRVIGVYRDFEMTAKAAFKKWPDGVGDTVKKAATSRDAVKRNQKFRFVQKVTKRDARDPGRARLDNRHKAWERVTVLVADALIVDESGFDENPYVTPRWKKRAGEAYGRSPAMKALGDIKMLQRTAKVNVAGAELAMRPPLAVADDGVIGPVRMKTNSLNHIRADLMMGSSMPIRPILTGSRPDIGEELMAAIRTRIDNAYFKPLIQLIRKDRMTATEVLEVMDQNQRILSPFLGRLKVEDVGPTVERVFALMLRGGGLLPMPAKLSERDVGVEYVSPAVKRQRLAQARGLAQFLEITAPLAAVKPEVHDNLDTDNAYRDTADIMGLPKNWVRKAETVGEIRTTRQQAQEEQAQRQAAAETVAMASDAARAMPALRQTLASPTEAFDAAA